MLVFHWKMKETIMRMTNEATTDLNQRHPWNKGKFIGPIPIAGRDQHPLLELGHLEPRGIAITANPWPRAG